LLGVQTKPLAIRQSLFRARQGAFEKELSDGTPRGKSGNLQRALGGGR
jgi:hypothetical protein